MSDFGPASTSLRLDPHKRVNYSLGLVLGEDEFRQEQYHLRQRDDLATRALHGYGTVSGLRVEAGETDVTVRPGVAIDPSGRFICVPTPQCADVAVWLRRHRADVEARLGSPPAATTLISLYVGLCYRDCPTDTVPIPVEPCRTAEENMVASRISDSFELTLSLEPPHDVGEVEGGALEAAIDSLVYSAAGSPPDAELPSPPDVVPAGGMVPPAVAAQDVTGLLQSWATGGRPEAISDACLDPVDACLLLARVDVELTVAEGELELASPPIVDDTDRPVVLSTRFLQEWLARLQASEAGEFAPVEPELALDDLTDVGAPAPEDGQILTRRGDLWVAEEPPAPAPPAPRALDDLTDVEAPTPADGQVLARRGDVWVATDPPSAAPPLTVHGEMTRLDADDHRQYLLADGSRELTGILRAGDHRLTDVADAVAPQDAVTLRQVEAISLPGGDAGGDLRGAYPDPRVVGLQTVPLSEDVPTAGDALVFDGKQWRPERVPLRVLPFVTITRLKPRLYELWFNVDAPENQLEVRELGEEEPMVHRETDSGSFLFLTPLVRRDRVGRNVFQVELKSESTAGLMRFTFNLDRVILDEGPASEIFEKLRVTFEGQSTQERTVTKFVRIFGEIG